MIEYWLIVLLEHVELLFKNCRFDTFFKPAGINSVPNIVIFHHGPTN